MSLMRFTVEEPGDHDAVARVTAAAFAAQAQGGMPVEVGLIAALRATDAWLPEFSRVARDGTAVVGHGLCTRGHVGDVPVLALGPLSVDPFRQGQGIGTRLVRELAETGDAHGEQLIALLGDPGYYARSGFVRASGLGVLPPVPEWDEHFQVLPLRAYDPATRGTFAYAGPFLEL